MKLLKFSANWCQPCQQLEKNLEALTDISIERVSIDIDENPELAAQHKVRGIPTMIALDLQGNELGRKVGALSAIQIKHWLEGLR